MVRQNSCRERVRGVLLAKGPDSSFGGVPVGYCSDDGHMEEEVQLKVQVEEEEMGETHGKEQGEEQRVKERTTTHENSESSQVDWKRETTFHCNLIQYPGILQDSSWNSSVFFFKP